MPCDQKLTQTYTHTLYQKAQISVTKDAYHSLPCFSLTYKYDQYYQVNSSCAHAFTFKNMLFQFPFIDMNKHGFDYSTKSIL